MVIYLTSVYLFSIHVCCSAAEGAWLLHFKDFLHTVVTFNFVGTKFALIGNFVVSYHAVVKGEVDVQERVALGRLHCIHKSACTYDTIVAIHVPN